VAGGWRRLQKEELHNLYVCIITMIKSRRMRWVGHAAHIREMKNTYKIFVGKTEWRRPLGRSGRAWVGKCEMDTSGSG
jgi:hypothetical protein